MSFIMLTAKCLFLHQILRVFNFKIYASCKGKKCLDVAESNSNQNRCDQLNFFTI